MMHCIQYILFSFEFQTVLHGTKWPGCEITGMASVDCIRCYVVLVITIWA